MAKAQVHNLTDDQIYAVYDHYERGDPAPEGVTLKGSFTRTMGRYFDGCSNPPRMRNY